MAVEELPTYCAKCGRTFYAAFDFQTMHASLWCRNCADVRLALHFRGRALGQFKQLLGLVEQTEAATNMQQGGDYLRMVAGLVRLEPITLKITATTAALDQALQRLHEAFLADRVKLLP